MGDVSRAYQHRHATARSDDAGKFGKPAIGVQLVQHCARQGRVEAVVRERQSLGGADLERNSVTKFFLTGNG